MAVLPDEYSRVNLSSDPIYRYLRITKGGPGGVPGRSTEQDLVDSPWLQRLRRIHQLQSAWWVFATAEHSRFQHALGAMHLAGEWARHLHPTLSASCSGTPSIALVEETMRMAGLLHDVGHGPFGHFFDENYLDTWGIDHEVVGRALITGPLAELVEGLGASPTADFEAGERIDPRWVAYLIASPELQGFDAPAWLVALKPAMVGAYSADNMDYVPRDSYICGVAAQESRAFNPLNETSDILLYDPLEDRFQQSQVLDLFRRLPVRMTLFRIFARDTAHSRELIAAANAVLGATT